jgi:hypothetical protein
VIGTTAGVVAALIAALSYRRDRPRLKITWQLEIERASVSMKVHVVNDGRQPVAVAETEMQNFDPTLAWRVRAFQKAGVLGWLNRHGWFPLPGRGGQSIRPTPHLPHPKTLQPGEPIDFTFPASRLEPFVKTHADKRLFIVVSDALGRTQAKRLPSETPDVIAALPEAARSHRSVTIS